MQAPSSLSNAFGRLKAFDERRPSFPGEHWATMSAGLWALRAARRPRSLAGRGALWLLGGLLLARAATGRDGPLASVQRMRALP